MKIRHALVLTAGLGTRLRPLTDVRAKPAIPVAGEPMIRRIVRWLASYLVDDLVLNLHHRPETLAAVMGDGSDLGTRVRYSWEQPHILGSAGGPRQALSIIHRQTFFVINGDTITDVNLEHLAEAHVASGALVTLALVPNHDFEHYGGVLVDPEQRVTGFVGRGPTAQGSWHFVGVQAVEASVFAAIPSGTHAKSIGGIYDELMRNRPGSVRAFQCDAEFWDVGTPRDYWRTCWALTSRAGQQVSSGQRVSIDPSARVSQSILWDDIAVAPRAVLEECIVTDGARIPRDAAYRRAIISCSGDDPDNISISPLDPKQRPEQ